VVGCVLLGKEGPQVGTQQNLPWLSCDRVTFDVRVALGFEELDDRLLQGSFAEFLMLSHEL